MQISRLFALFIISATIFCKSPEQFNTCPSTEKLQATVEKLTEQILRNEKVLQELVTALTTEQKEKQALQKLKHERILQEIAEAKKAEELLNSLPKYQYYSLQAIATVLPWVQNQLLPTVQAILTNMIAQKIVHGILDSTDFVCGDVPEKIFPNRFGTIIALRPGEWLTLSHKDRKHNNLCRKLETSEFKRMKKELEKLEQEEKTHRIIETTEQKLNELRAQQALQSNPEYQQYFAELKALRSELSHFQEKQKLAQELAILTEIEKTQSNFDEYFRSQYRQYLINRQQSTSSIVTEENS